MVNLEKSKILLNWNCRQQSLCICWQVSDCQITPAGIKMFILTQIFRKFLTFSKQNTLYKHKHYQNVMRQYLHLVSPQNEKLPKIGKIWLHPAVPGAIIRNPTASCKGVEIICKAICQRTSIGTTEDRGAWLLWQGGIIRPGQYLIFLTCCYFCHYLLWWVTERENCNEYAMKSITKPPLKFPQ